MISPWLTAALLVAGTVAPVSGQKQTTASIFGSVLDQESGKPIAEVHISVDSISTTSSAAGRFALRSLPVGVHVIRFERLGYLTRTDTVRVGPGLPLDVAVKLATSPIPLDPIDVVVRSGVLQREGFFDRRDFELNGTFFTEVDIQRLAPVALTDVMQRVQSALVIHGGPGRMLVRFNRQVGMGGGRLPGCEPAVFLDGVLIQDQLSEPRLLNFNRVDPSAVAGIEVYVGVNTPLQYRRTPCGSVLIWTKRGE